MAEQDKEAKKEPIPTGVVSTRAATEGINGPFPAELKGWNWGGFLLTWIWGVSHNIYISLLPFLVIFIPGINMLAWCAMAIYLGIKGNELAWRKRKFASVEEFKAVQAAWTKWGVIVAVASFILGIIVVGFATAYVIRHPEALTQTETNSSYSIHKSLPAQESSPTDAPTSNFPF